MTGTKSGGVKTRITNLKKYGKDYYKRIGAMGGKAGSTGGFYGCSERARAAGAKGGRRSRRGYKFLFENRLGDLYYLERDTGDKYVIRKGSYSPELVGAE